MATVGKVIFERNPDTGEIRSKPAPTVTKVAPTAKQAWDAGTLVDEYKVIGKILSENTLFYQWDEAEFVGRCMRESRGKMNPKRLKEVWEKIKHYNH